jgi:predicted DNA-binding protein (UPF0251 family)
MPRVDAFGPAGKSEQTDTVILSVDEYEAIRLMDLEGLDQDRCADQMGVARSTIQRIYENARKKLADFLVNGKPLRIEGGDYRLCETAGTDDFGCHGRCRRCGWPDIMEPRGENEDKP